MVKNVEPGGSLSSPTEFNSNAIVQAPTVDISVADLEFKPTEITVETSRFAETARVDLIGLWNGEGAPSKGTPIELNINGERVFTGDVEKSSNQGDGTIKVVGFDLVKRLLRTKIDKNYNSVDLERIVKDVADAADATFSSVVPEDVIVSPDYNNTAATQVLAQVSKWANALWWIDEFNVIHVGPPLPETFNIGAEFVKPDPSVGTRNIPYERVVVQGLSPASQSIQGLPGGLESIHMLAKDPIVAIAGEGEPTYTYKSKQIRTKRQAENTAQAILDEFRRQQASGKFKLVGEGAPIRPLDTVVMPEVLGGDEYLVNSVKHTFNNSDGFISDITVGGFID